MPTPPGGNSPGNRTPVPFALPAAHVPVPGPDPFVDAPVAPQSSFPVHLRPDQLRAQAQALPPLRPARPIRRLQTVQSMPGPVAPNALHAALLNVQAAATSTTHAHRPESILSVDQIRALLPRSNTTATAPVPIPLARQSVVPTPAPVAAAQANQHARVMDADDDDEDSEEDNPVEPQYGAAMTYKQFNHARDPSFDLHNLATHNMGPMNVACPNCQALHWDCERLTKSSKRNPKFGMCCLSGNVALPMQNPPPPQLMSLFNGQTVESKNFLQHIRKYNAAFAFTSLGVKTVNLPGHGPYVFKIQGMLSHRIGSLLPDANDDATYAQLYFHDSREALNIRVRRNHQEKCNFG